MERIDQIQTIFDICHDGECLSAGRRQFYWLIFHIHIISYNKVTVIGTAASRVYFHLKAEAVRMGE